MKARATRPSAIQYAPALLDEVRAHITEALERSPDRSEESGGVLFGVRKGDVITVTAMRPVTIAHAQGPAFTLGPDDGKEFEHAIGLAQTDVALAGTEAVGWFLSHTRDSLVLRPSDREIFNRFFGEPWQIVLVVRPGLIGSLRAATIGRGSGEEPEPVLNSFNIRQLRSWQAAAGGSPGLAGSAIVPVKVISSEPAPGLPLALEKVETKALERIPAPVPVPQPMLLPAPVSRPKRIPLQPVVAIAGVLTVAAAGFWYVRAHAVEPVGLTAYQRDGVLRIEWDTGSRSVIRASSAKLRITDGDAVTSRDLGTVDLNRGLWAVLCKRADCTARLSLYDGSELIKEETARYAGRAATAADGGDPDTVRRLEAEKEELRQALERERERTAELNTRVKALQKIIRGGEER